MVLTYGEALYAQRELCELKDGEIVIKKLPKRMKKQDGLKYYNKKLWDYWQKNYKLKERHRKLLATAC